MGGRQRLRPLVAAEGRQGFDAEQSLQALDGRAGIKVEWIGPADWGRPDQREQARPIPFGRDQLRRSQPGQLIAKRVFGRLDAQQRELAGGTVQRRDAVVVRPQADRDRVVGAATLEIGILDDGAGRQHPDYLAPNQAARFPGRLDLVAEGHLQPGAQQLSDIALVGVVGNARHRIALPLAELARGERDA